LKFCEKFLSFFGKITLYDKIVKILLRKFLSRLGVVMFKLVKFGQRVIGEILRYLVDQKKQNVACLSNCRYCADRAQNLPYGQPQQCTQSAPDFIQIDTNA